MGHNHTPEVLIWVNEMEKIKTYVNTGDWVEHQTYVTIENGVVRLRNWQLEEEKRNSLSSAAKK
jgi:UDP-2,3-diacylglucosamine pyrophosphatase LpxH